jgi:hypothetical protein
MPYLDFDRDFFSQFLPTGSALMWPTIDLPPDTFGTHDDEHCSALVWQGKLEGREEKGFLEGKVFMTYFTRVGPEEVKNDDPSMTTI